MSAPAQTFYEPASEGVFRSTRSTAGPWSSEAQHGGPPAALLARAVERLRPEAFVGRFTMDLLGPVPVDDLSVTATVLRPGRTVSLVQAELTGPTGPGGGSGRVVARAQAWLFPVVDVGPAGTGVPLPHDPASGHHEEFPAHWEHGYFDSVEWRWVEGSMSRPGPGTVWMRPRVPLLPDEELSPLQRLLLCADSASGVSSELDVREWNFMNTELTVHQLRPVQGEWVCLQATTTLSTGSVGVAAAEVYDERGPVGRSAQALLVVRR